MSNSGFIMDYNRMMQFIRDIDTPELREELRALDANHGMHIRFAYETFDSHYLKAARQSLIAIGFAKDWVESTLRFAMEDYCTEQLDIEKRERNCD